MVKDLPTDEMPTTGQGNSTQYHLAWNPRLWLWIGVPLFLIATFALFIATKFWVGHPNDTPAFVSGVIGMITLGAIMLQILVSRRQWEVMQEGLKRTDALIKLTESAFYTSERAYFGTKNWSMKKTEGEEETHTVIAYLDNGGRTPAWNVRVQGKLSVSNPVPFTWEENGAKGSSVPAGKNKGFTVAKCKIPEALWIQIQMNEVTLYIDGECRYRDITNATQGFRFGFTMINPQTAPIELIERYFDHLETMDNKIEVQKTVVGEIKPVGDVAKTVEKNTRGELTPTGTVSFETIKGDKADSPDNSKTP